MSAWFEELLSALAEAVVVDRMLSAAGRLTGWGIQGPWFFALAAASHVAGHAAAAFSVGRLEQNGRKLLLAFWVLSGAVLGAFVFLEHGRIGFGGAFVCFLTWLACSARGIMTITQPRNSDSVRRGFVLGVLALSCFSLLRTERGVGDVASVFAFAILCSALLVVERRREVTERLSAPEETPWTVGGTVFILAALFLALVLYGAGSGGFGAVAAFIGVLWGYLVTVLGYALVPIAYLVQWLIAGVRRILVSRETQEIKLPRSPLEDLGKQLEETRPGIIAPWVKWGLLGLALISLAAAAWFVASRLQRRSRRETQNETRISLGEGEVMKEWLADMAVALSDLMSTAGRRIRRLLKTEPQTLEEIYVAALDLLGRRGMPRKPHLTPYEYLTSVAAGLPDEGELALTRLTQIFAKLHYSERLATPTEIGEALTAYRGLLDSLRSDAKVRKGQRWEECS